MYIYGTPGSVGRGRGQHRGSGRRGGQRGRGPYRTVRKSKPLDKKVDHDNPHPLSEAENTSGALGHDLGDVKKAIVSSPPISKGKREPSLKGHPLQKEECTEAVSIMTSAEQNLPKVQRTNPEGNATAVQRQDDAVKEQLPSDRPSHGKTDNGNGSNINTIEKGSGMQRRESNASSTDKTLIATPKGPHPGKNHLQISYLVAPAP